MGRCFRVSVLQDDKSSGNRLYNSVIVFTTTEPTVHLEMVKVVNFIFVYFTKLIKKNAQEFLILLCLLVHICNVFSHGCKMAPPSGLTAEALYPEKKRVLPLIY